jgi:purine-binding chemotaxis protein CheW
MGYEMILSSDGHHMAPLVREQEFVTMKVGNQLFGISVMTVQDVLRKQRITTVPLAPAIVSGSLNLRGRIVTAIDMRVRLGMPTFENPDLVMHVVVENKGELYSLMVDGVGDVLSLPLRSFEKTPSNLSESWASVAAGVFKLEKELLVILDVDHIIWK